MKARLFPPAVAGMLILGCVSERLPTPPSRPDPEAGMVWIPSAGKSFLQGSAGPGANPIEGPAIINSFSYDFQIDVTETTQGAFADLMGWEPVPAASPAGAGHDLPVYNVSWFDAVLFCNARSKARNLDTVYEYTGVGRNPEGGVFRLDGLSVHLDRRGFRLPTEAEWEYSARAGGGGIYPWGGPDSSAAAEHAWFAGNAGNRVHPVKGLKANAYGLHDMAGNVMEWVGDWKAPYPATGAEDFSGARDAGPEFDSPIKGGAFKFGLHELRPAARSGVYASIRSSRSEYVGFRCALGAIKSPRFATAGGGLAGTDAVRLDLHRVGGLVEGRAAKLVFVNVSSARRQMAYVDYREYPARVREFEDIDDVYHPSISPDGAWVAFGSSVEGVEEGSRIRVRSLDRPEEASVDFGEGFIPRWWIAERDTFLIYATAGTDNWRPQWAASRTLMRKVSGGAPIGPPITLPPEGGFHDGRSRDGRWLATGFRLLKVHDLAGGGTRTLFVSPDNGKAGEDTSQVCNVSMAPDSSGRLLFLDFGYDAVSRITGSWYDIHQVAFMASPEGKVRRWFRAPTEVRGWEDLEWSNHPDFAVSGSTEKEGGNRRLYLINLRDSTYARLASGTRLAMPALWLGRPADSLPTEGLDLDSLGHYDAPGTDIYQSVFANKMALFWKRHQSIEVLFTGSSHVYSGIDPRRITGLQAFSMGYPANGWLGQEAWAAAYALNHCPKLKVLVMEAFPGWLYHPGGDFTWVSQMSRTMGVRYDQDHGWWKDGLPHGFAERVRAAPNPTHFVSDSTGFVPSVSAGWGTDPLGVNPDWNWGADHSEYQGTMARIEAFARLLADRGIHLLLVNHPTHPGYKGHAYYGPYGPTQAVAAKVIERFRAMESISPFVHFYDAHDFGNHDYGDVDALNWGHLSSTGAAKLTDRLDSLIRTFP